MVVQDDVVTLCSCNAHALAQVVEEAHGGRSVGGLGLHEAEASWNALANGAVECRVQVLVRLLAQDGH